MSLVGLSGLAQGDEEHPPLNTPHVESCDLPLGISGAKDAGASSAHAGTRSDSQISLSLVHETDISSKRCVLAEACYFHEAGTVLELIREGNRERKRPH